MLPCVAVILWYPVPDVYDTWRQSRNVDEPSVQGVCDVRVGKRLCTLGQPERKISLSLCKQSRQILSH